MTLPQTCSFFFFFNDTATTEIYTLSLHDALPILGLQFDSSYKLTAGFNIAGTLLLQDTKYLSGVVTDGRRGSPSGGTLQVDLTDNELPLTPHVTLNLRVGQTFGGPGGSMDWVVSANYKSSQFLTAFNGAPGHNGAKQVTAVDAAGVTTASGPSLISIS